MACSAKMDRSVFGCFNDKVAVITGAGGTIGGGTAVLFAEYGARLALIDNHRGRLDDTLGRLRAQGLPDSRVLAHVGDVSSEDDVIKFIEDTITKFGQIDHLINIVGAKFLGTMEKTTLKDVEGSMLDLYATYSVTKACLPYLTRSKGSVVNMSSIAGLVSFGYTIAFGAVQTGLLRMTKNMALDLASKGVRVNVVCPSSIRSDHNLHTGVCKTREELDEYFRAASKTIPLGRVADVDDVTYPILFLCSDKASFITGAVLPIDGAYTLSVGQ